MDSGLRRNDGEDNLTGVALTPFARYRICPATHSSTGSRRCRSSTPSSCMARVRAATSAHAPTRPGRIRAERERRRMATRHRHRRRRRHLARHRLHTPGYPTRTHPTAPEHRRRRHCPVPQSRRMKADERIAGPLRAIATRQSAGTCRRQSAWRRRKHPALRVLHRTGIGSRCAIFCYVTAASSPLAAPFRRRSTSA